MPNSRTLLQRPIITLNLRRKLTDTEEVDWSGPLEVRDRILAILPDSMSDIRSEVLLTPALYAIKTQLKTHKAP